MTGGSRPREANATGAELESVIKNESEVLLEKRAFRLEKRPRKRYKVTQTAGL
jgi:hypothetical protein